MLEEKTTAFSEIERLETELIRVKAEMQEQERAFRKEKIRMEGELLKTRARYEAIENSTIWKLSSPVRKIINGLKLSLYRNPLTRMPYRFISVWKRTGIKTAIHMVCIKQKEYQLQRRSSKTYNKLKETQFEENNFKVSIIVPCYNHAQYLKRRLDSIYSQTYKNYEVILLDDASTDNSVTILKEYAVKHSDNTRLFLNNENSGGVFHQWKKGISVSEGNLCWIAESDDFADPNFLNVLTKFFTDDAVMLAYAHMNFWQENSMSSFSYEQYLAPIENNVWNNTYVRSAYEEVKDGLGIKNVIPNASGVVFRRPDVNFELFNNSEFLNMKICGDWIFYLNIIAGGKVAYSPSTNNYFNLHDDSSSKITHTQDCYYSEHKMVAETIRSLYKDTEKALIKNHLIVREYYFSTVKDSSIEKFDKLYDVHDVINSNIRKISILISIFAFSLGGGEIFPIRLANALKHLGYPVTIHCLRLCPREPEVLKMLRKDIPIVYAQTGSEFKELLEHFKFDVINTHHQSNQHMISKLYEDNPACLKGIKHIATMHGMYENLPDEYILNYLPVIDQCVTVWTRVADKNLDAFEFADIYDEKKHVLIPNGIEIPDSFYVNRTDLGISDTAFVLCLASRALPEKGWREAMEAVEIARNISQKDIHLILLGKGEMYDCLSKEELPSYIHLLGFVSDTCQYYNISDMGILPSYFAGESMPLTIMEAFSVGKPVISSVIGETPWLLQEGTETAGALFNLRDGKVPVKEVAELIATFSQQEVLYERAHKAALKKAKDYNIQNVAKQYLDIFLNK
ncbi:MAG: glycosyltransferase [Clostridiales bacterium]|nr:glycosyltransferase [Clostridiales bacterium]